MAHIVVRRRQRQVQRALQVQPVGGGGGRRAEQRGGVRPHAGPLVLLLLHLQLGGHQLLLEMVVLLELLVLVGLELVLGAGGQQGLEGAALLVLLAGLTVLDEVVAGRRMLEAVPMAVGGTSIALHCRGGGIGLVVGFVVRVIVVLCIVVVVGVVVVVVTKKNIA